ncbi:eukaryotic translation initiation factor 3 subunit G-domain-containing protein [Mycena filopes]|nr:eukaryotic translation initiation factor 3 subunit G-domain-containing protein [Mycena filopes]KAJ7167790.1 eukaryotic translation initiation factor 3 subunit G-domain-containing protein [Mycena filopes]
MAVAVPKTSWADELDAVGQENSDFVDANGIRTTIEYTVNEEGKRVKITRRTKRTLQVVDHAVAGRLKWSKFGQEKGKPQGPDRATTTVGENVTLKISAGNKHGAEPEKVEEESTKTKLAKAGAGKVMCRLCKGEHFTAKCPHKEALAGLEDAGAGDDETPSADAPIPAAASGSGTGKYVPIFLRNPGARPSGPSAGSRDELPTLRVTNLSEDTQENDLRELFGIFGRVARVFVGRDRETGAGKGFAFVSFEERAVAQKAMEKVHGKGYDNLILSVQWSLPKPEGK